MLCRSLVPQSVIILDDVWEEFSLEKVRMALDANKCRLILTTRSLQLCNRMHCQRKFDVKTLDSNEAWDLFKHTFGHETILAAEGEEIAKLVAKRCAGLPLGIITVAGSMSGVTDIREWRNTLEQLKASSIGYEEMEDKVFPILEWSFTRLKGCERLCFLYCCLYPEDWDIEREELISLFILAELIPRRNTRDSEFDHGHKILNKLIKVCLLEETEDCNGHECVKMHDLIRDMALRITRGISVSNTTEDVHRFLVKSIGAGSTAILEQKEWTEDLNAVSFAGVSIDDLSRIDIPECMSPNCPNLSTFLFRNANIEKIPDTFFRHIDGLKVLNLQGCESLKELPNCISHLVNLTGLLLKGCSELASVPPLGKLKQLRELDVSYTGIFDVPKGLEKLVKLECLYMHKTELTNQTLPKGTFSKHHHLQHLMLPMSVEVRDPEVLKQLQVFRGHVSFIDVYNQFTTSPCWPLGSKQHKIQVSGSLSSDFDDYGDLFSIDRKILKFHDCHFQEGLDVVLPPEDIRELALHKCFGFSDVFFHHLIKRSKDLSRLSIRQSDTTEFLLNLSSPPPSVAPLQNLQLLELNSLANFVGLINWGCSSLSSEASYFRRNHQQLIPAGTFSSLKELYISKCHKMKMLFSVQLMQQSLQNLEWLNIDDCEQLEEIAAKDDHQVGEDIILQATSSAPTSSTIEVRLPRLRCLYLAKLPQLESICKGTMICKSIETLSVYGYTKVKRLPLFLSINTTNGQPSPPEALREIRGSKKWWESLEWDNPSAKHVLQPFFKGW